MAWGSQNTFLHVLSCQIFSNAASAAAFLSALVPFAMPHLGKEGLVNQSRDKGATVGEALTSRRTPDVRV